MAYATIEDIKNRMTRDLSTDEETVATSLLDDAAVIIDTYNANATAEAKKVVSCRMVIRALGDGDTSVPMGATQGSQSGMLRALATQFSAASGLSVTDTGVVNDANPTSSDAILAQSQTLIATAEQLNASNGYGLRNIILMALAIQNDVALDGLTDEQKAIVAHFKNPAMPSVAVTADAAIKIASAREGFAQTDTFLEMIGFDKADVRRIKAQEQRAAGLAIFREIE